MAKRKTRGFSPFEKGDLVWLDGRNLKIGYPSQKLAPKREGPFKITEVLGPVSYRLSLPDQWKIHPVFHASLLSPYRETDTHGPNYTRPPPDLIEGEEEFEVEAIIAHRKRGNGHQYLVKWKGYPHSDKPTTNLKGASEILRSYRTAQHL